MKRFVLAALLSVFATSAIAAENWVTVLSLTQSRSGGTVTATVQHDTNNTGAPGGYARYRATYSMSGTILPDNPATSGGLRIRIFRPPSGSNINLVEKTPYNTTSAGTTSPDIIPNGQDIQLIAEWQAYDGTPNWEHLETKTWEAGEPAAVEAQASAPGPARKSDLLTTTNPYSAPMKVTYTDKVTGEVLMERTLQPGESLHYKLQTNATNDVEERFTLMDTAYLFAPDQDGNTQVFFYGPGYTWTGSDLTSSNFSTTEPDWQAPTTRTVSPPTADATHVPNPTPEQTPKSNPGSTTVSNGTAKNVSYSTATGTGGASDVSVREGTSAIVGKLSDIEKAIKDGAAPTDPQPIEVDVDISPINDKLDEVKDEFKRGRPGSATVDLSTMTAESSQAAAGTQMTGMGTGMEGAAGGSSDAFGVMAGQAGHANGPSSGAGISLGTISVQSIGLNIAMDVDEHFPWFRDACNYLREAFLWGLAFLFIRAISESAAKYQIAITNVPQTLTLEEPGQLWIPGVGWGKQLAVSLTVIGIIAAHLAALIVVSNTRLGDITGSWTITNIKNIANVVISGGGSTGNKAFKMVDMFFPVVASVQFGLSWIALTFAQMGAFAVASAIIKGTRV